MKALVPGFLILLLLGCAKAPLISTPELQVLETGELPVPTRTDLLAANRPYLIGPFDKLKIDVFGVEELQREVQTDASGRLSFPLIGVVEAAGSTPGELAAEIERRLAGRFVRNPQVTVNLTETVSQVITVDGQVDKPGLYPVIGNMTLVRAVATAGGVSEFASLDDIVVFRTVNGQRFAALYNLKAIRRGAYPDPEVFANDVVVVGDSQARRIFRDILQAAPLLTTPIVVLSRN
ncbi:MAG: polysaccharide export protein [Altererythrobacter sp.]|nr:polysaccharide export protein [Altererythrobacter sp.]